MALQHVRPPFSAAMMAVSAPLQPLRTSHKAQYYIDRKIAEKKVTIEKNLHPLNFFFFSFNNSIVL